VVEMTRKRQLTGFRLEVVPDTEAKQDKVEGMLGLLGARHLRTKASGEITGRVRDLDFEKMVKYAGLLKSSPSIMEVTVAPLYSD
jgi:hypothetical protein